MPTRPALRNEPPDRQGGAGGPPTRMTAWRQPVVWLGAAIFVASLIGCVLTILLASRHDDPALGQGVEYLMKVPVERLPADPAPRPR
jgi:hypothetical protein